MKSWNSDLPIVCTYCPDVVNPHVETKKNKIHIGNITDQMIQNVREKLEEKVFNHDCDYSRRESSLIAKHQHKFLSILHKNINQYLNDDIFILNYEYDSNSFLSLNKFPMNDLPLPMSNIIQLGILLDDKIRMPHVLSNIIVDYVLFPKTVMIDIFPFQEILSIYDPDEIKTISNQTNGQEIDSTIAYYLTSNIVDSILFLVP